MDKIWFLCSVLIVLCVHCCMPSLAKTSLTNLSTDHSALLIFKSYITFNASNYFLAQNWSARTSCCTWIGITCGARHKRVTSLSIPGLGLTGTIPPALGNLSFLASLDIENNSLHGHLPHELGFLQRLNLINLGYNDFSGEIPLWLGTLPKLQHLSLSSNSFSGTIPTSLGNLSSLQTLRLDSNSLSGTIPRDMCNHLPELVALYLHNNRLSGQMPLGMYKCSQLQFLALADNKFTGSIPREFGNLTRLKKLYLYGNTMEGEIPEEIGYLRILEVLALEASGLTGPIPSAIFNLSTLREIDVSNNSLSGTLPLDMCHNLPALQILYLYNNKFMGSIPRGIENCTSLVEISLFNNYLSGTIPHGIGNLRNIELLYLAENSLTGFILPEIFNSSTMKYIALTSNYLSGQLPSRIGLQLPNLKGLYLGKNRLDGAIPNSISNASKLTIVSLFDNSFSGTVPDTFGNLRLLEALSINSNFLVTESSSLGLSFITSLTNCKNLRSLDFSANPLGGFLPISIGNLSSSLQFFNAVGCKIKGSIPREVGNLKNLIAFRVQRNELTGTIPSAVGKLLKLQGLYLEHNRLEGAIPYDICHLVNLADLSLYDNKLSGPIPTCVGNLTSLRDLYLDANKLTSIIPSALWSLTYILEINLSTNSLSGYLSLDIGNLKVMTRMDLSHNQLSGNIPNTLGGLQHLVSLSLTNNRFQGPIPESFGTLTSLELLDLCKNNLSGVIPKSLETLRYLKYINLSFNRLSGEIPNGGPFANFSAPSFMMNNALCGASRLQVPLCKKETHRSRPNVPLLLECIFPPIVSILLATTLIIMFIRCRKKNLRLPIQQDLSPLALRRISFQELQQATDGFSESNLLGMGSFGSVYKGILSDGLNVAIKAFNLQVDGWSKSFDAECEVLGNTRHRNLIKIISSCCTIDFKSLVLEYMPYGSLDKWLHSHKYCLDILQRLNIMIDVASALEYLHHGYTNVLVHCDLKPSNVLLDKDMIAHVSDFGISKLLDEDESMAHTMTLATIGYMAPEYGSEGAVSTGGDVYSYGILMIEVFTRKKPTDDMFSGEMSLKSWVKESLPHAIIEVADSKLLRKEEEHLAAKMDCIVSVLNLALDCSVDVPERRPDIRDVLITLQNIRAKFQICVVGT